VTYIYPYIAFNIFKYWNRIRSECSETIFVRTFKY